VEKVTFFSDGAKISANLYLPANYKNAGKTPGIVVCGGYTSEKEGRSAQVVPPLTAAGFACLIFDYRGWGESEGERNRLICSEQVEDIKSATSYLLQRDEVDAEKVGLVGLSLGGSHVVSAGAEDQRVKYVVGMFGVGDGARWLRGMRTLVEWRRFQEEVEKDSLERVKTGKSKYWDSLDVMRLSKEEKEAYLSTHKKTELSLSSAESLMNYRPEAVANRISPRPIFFVHTESELLVPYEETISMCKMAGEPKDLWIIPSSLVKMHFDVYKSPGPCDEVMKVVTDWIKGKLRI
jgi:fermentation-respiration switch protein FrsA (DUF1100 family)